MAALPEVNMRTTIFMAITVFLAAAASIIAAPEITEQRATIKNIIGQVEVSAGGSAKWRPARVSMPVTMGYDIRTFVESSVDIELENGTLIKIGENTVATLSKLLQDGSGGASSTSLKIGTGKIWANVKKLANAKSEFEFETPTAVASIRGTRLGINVDAGGTAIDVFEGLVQVREKSTGKTVNVPTKGRATVQGGGKGLRFIDLAKTSPRDSVKAPMIDPFSDTAAAPSKKADSTADSDRHGNSSGKPVNALVLKLASPKDGAIISEPMIPVAGTVTPGATVLINNVSITVNPSGNFNYKAPIPDEPHEYSISVVARLGDRETGEERSVVYSPAKATMFLDITTPAEGQVIKQNLLRVTGKTGPRASVTVNNRQAMVSAQGLITYDIPLSERDIGEYRLEIIATDDSKELSKIITVTIDIGSPAINTSAPSIVVQERGVTAGRTGKLNVDVLDRTPGDQIALQFQNNGRFEEYAMAPGERQSLNLDEGKNKYTVKALDKAKNVSNVVTGTTYFLPGPLVIEIRDPAENPVIIDDLPPMPKNVAASQMRVEVEIIDGIGNVPETIRYCRLVGNGQTLQMVGNNNYRYHATIPLTHGTLVYSIQVEDLTGNIMTKRLDITVK
jgi:hypothetical protein